MTRKLLDFIKYNNAFTIIVGLFFFSFGITYAANPAVRESIYSSEETVVSIDNSLIVSADLDNFNFNLRINSVTEDEKNYYATYSFQTLTIKDSIWQNKEIEKTLTASREALNGKDFGLYLAKELGENINYELSYLKRVQKLENEKGASQKIITVEYSGLIGKLLDPKEMVIEGYNPVIPEVIPEVPATVESNPEEVIVSVPYVPTKENPIVEPAPPQADIIPEPVPSSTSSPQTTSAPIETPLPAPEEMVDESLVQEVVEKLLQEEASSTPDSTPSDSSEQESPLPTTPEAVPEPVTEAAPQPVLEIIPTSSEEVPESTQ